LWTYAIKTCKENEFLKKIIGMCRFHFIDPWFNMSKTLLPLIIDREASISTNKMLLFLFKLNISPFVTLYLCKMFCFWGEGWGYTSFCWVGKSDGRSLYMLYNTNTLKMNARHYYYMQGPSQTWPFQVQCCYYYIMKLVSFIWTVWHLQKL